MFTYDYPFLLLFTCLLVCVYHVYSCMFTYVYQCLLVFTYVYTCLPKFTRLLVFT